MGVTTNAINRVLNVERDDHGLEGTVPSEIGLLVELRGLMLDGNYK